MILGATRVAIATQDYQPNKESTADLILSSEEVPSGSWTSSIEQDIPTNSFNKRDPEMHRAGLMWSTTSKRLFKNSTLGTVLIEVSPLATSTDADSWVLSAGERVKRKMMKYVELAKFEALDDIVLANVGQKSGFEYKVNDPNGLRSSVVVAASVSDIYVIVTCTDYGREWSLEEVLDIVRAQVEKIRNTRVSSIE
jgi:hypothetical protein